MQLLHLRGGFLHEHRPDIVPQGFVTEEELALWCAYLELRNAETKVR